MRFDALRLAAAALAAAWIAAAFESTALRPSLLDAFHASVAAKRCTRTQRLQAHVATATTTDRQAEDGAGTEAEADTCPVCLRDVLAGDVLFVAHPQKSQPAHRHALHFACFVPMAHSRCPVCNAPFDFRADDLLEAVIWARRDVALVETLNAGWRCIAPEKFIELLDAFAPLLADDAFDAAHAFHRLFDVAIRTHTGSDVAARLFVRALDALEARGCTNTAASYVARVAAQSAVAGRVFVALLSDVFAYRAWTADLHARLNEAPIDDPQANACFVLWGVALRVRNGDVDGALRYATACFDSAFEQSAFFVSTLLRFGHVTAARRLLQSETFVLRLLPCAPSLDRLLAHVVRWLPDCFTRLRCFLLTANERFRELPLAVDAYGSFDVFAACVAVLRVDAERVASFVYTASARFETHSGFDAVLASLPQPALRLLLNWFTSGSRGSLFVKILALLRDPAAVVQALANALLYSPARLADAIVDFVTEQRPELRYAMLVLLAVEAGRRPTGSQVAAYAQLLFRHAALRTADDGDLWARLLDGFDLLEDAEMRSATIRNQQRGGQRSVHQTKFLLRRTLEPAAFEEREALYRAIETRHLPSLIHEARAVGNSSLAASLTALWNERRSEPTS